ncbi:MAG: WhiB family transcriptional regulator [Actinomycetota bacterium]|nr:WhiB family transcriptional regulator [Actinomycetota bacterium]
MRDAGGWRRRAECRSMGPELFFPVGEKEDAAAAQTAAAKQVCARCEVRLHCLAYALAARVEAGVWGGLSPSERMALAQRRNRHRAKGRLHRATG